MILSTEQERALLALMKGEELDAPTLLTLARLHGDLLYRAKVRAVLDADAEALA